MREIRNENRDWRFCPGDPKGAVEPAFDDRDWRRLDLPHDFMIEGAHDPDTPAGANTGFLPGGIGWYRKRLILEPGWRDKRVRLEFDGVMAHGRIFVNGRLVAYRPNGYLGFAVDLTDHLRIDGTDLIAVQADTREQPASRWYTGAGIYRDVRLVITEPLHIARHGIHARLRTVNDREARIQVAVELESRHAKDQPVDLVCTVTEGESIIAQSTGRATVGAGDRTTSAVNLVLNHPRRWQPDDPHLYRLTVEVRQDGRPVDEAHVPLGVRTIEFDPDRGFRLNGVQTKLQGVCMHEDLGPLGMKVFRDAIARRLKRLKQAGVNAVRCAHHPFSAHFYDLCDRLGLLVIDEAFDEWRKGKRPFTYHRFFDEWWERDLTDQIRAHRNHPSIILWSVGNEIPEKASSDGVKTLKMLRDACHRLDPTRPVTAGCNGIDGANASGFAAELDVVGINGGGGSCFRYDENHDRYPGRKLYASEVPHTFATRGVYKTKTQYRDQTLKPSLFARMERVEVPDLTEVEVFDDVHPAYYSSYDNALVRINVRDSWALIAEREFMAGEFRWTGADYLGESHGWPAKHSNAGILDLCGFPKDPYYLYQALWTADPMIHLLPHWTHPGWEGTVIPVCAYSNCEGAELWVSGRSAGRRRVTNGCAWWYVPYQAGELRGVGFRSSDPTAEDVVRTAGPPASVRLTLDRREIPADRMALAHVEARVLDGAGVLVPTAANALTFEVTGPGELIAVGNGDPISDEPAVATTRRAFAGMAVGIVRSTAEPGEIAIAAEAAGLRGDAATLSVRG